MVLGKNYFDLWSERYDNDIKDEKGYPFEGYQDILSFIYKNIKKDSEILDIGCGTGIIAEKLSKKCCKIYGVDFSDKMIKKAKDKVKDGIFMVCDIKKGLPEVIRKKRFDYIISTYVFHHFEDDEKIKIIKDLTKILKKSGKIIIGDVAFRKRKDLEKCRDIYYNIWDDDEIYIVYEEMEKKLKEESLKSAYYQISTCAGILVIYNASC